MPTHADISNVRESSTEDARQLKLVAVTHRRALESNIARVEADPSFRASRVRSGRMSARAVSPLRMSSCKVLRSTGLPLNQWAIGEVPLEDDGLVRVQRLYNTESYVLR